MALIALLGGSTIGAVCGIFGWLFLEIGLVPAIALYLGISLGLPAVVIAITALRRKTPDHGDAAYADESDVIAA